MLTGLPNPPSRFADNSDAGQPGGGAATAGATRQQITTEDQPCVAVFLQSPGSNTDGIEVGSATASCRALEPGQTRLLRIDNANKVYVKRAGSSNQTVNWCVLRE